jgi:two-component system, NarL family, response regulator NreC
MAAHLHLAERADEPDLRQPQAPPIRVLLADDHRAVRRSMRLLLDNEDDVEVIAEADDIATVLLELSAQVPHVLALDPRIHEGSGIEAIRRLRSEVPQTEIIVLTMDASSALAHHSLLAGAIGFVLKDTADDELVEAIRHAARGQHYVSARVEVELGAPTVNAVNVNGYEAS